MPSGAAISGSVMSPNYPIMTAACIRRGSRSSARRTTSAHIAFPRTACHGLIGAVLHADTGEVLGPAETRESAFI